jgi:hypothetical protein
MRAPRKARSVGGAIFVLGLLGAVACGSRGPLDIGGSYGVDASSGTTVDAAQDVSTSDAAGDAGEDAPERGDAGFQFDSGIPAINCLVCVGQTCGNQLGMCALDTSCRTVLQCVIQTCAGAGGGGIDPQCVLTCGQSDPNALVQVFQVLQCIVQGCGADCASVLSGLGGGGTGGGGGAGGSGGAGGGGGPSGGSDGG